MSNANWTIYAPTEPGYYWVLYPERVAPALLYFLGGEWQSMGTDLTCPTNHFPRGTKFAKVEEPAIDVVVQWTDGGRHYEIRHGQLWIKVAPDPAPHGEWHTVDTKDALPVLMRRFQMLARGFK